MRKIPTIFKRNPDRAEVLDEKNSECAWVFAGEGKATLKYDGTCCKIDDDGFWKRREVKRGKPEPEGFVLEQEDGVTGKKFGWVKVDPASPEDRWHMEAYASSDMTGKRGTFELCGPKIQGNPEGFTEHILISHADAHIFEINDRSYEGIRQFLSGLDVEGLVFHHEDGRMAKIKKSDFGLKR